jgi:hypothetical protein
MAAAMLEGFLSRRAGHFNGKNGTAENRPYFRADRNIPLHEIKPGLRRQDLEGIHLPSFRFSWKLKELCRFDCFVFESWQNTVKSQDKTITSSAVCHNSKTKK